MATPTTVEPGTGTEIHYFASLPKDESCPNVYTINGKTWGCGCEYWDSRTREIVELVGVVGRSAWCDTRPADEQTPMLKFEGPRGYFRVDTVESPDPEEPAPNERFTLHRIQDPAGVKDEVWPGVDP